MAKAIVLRDYGTSDVMRLEDVSVAAPGANEILVRQTAIGVHFHDIYVRTGLYKTLRLPGTPGLEAAGVVDAVGAGTALPLAAAALTARHERLRGLCQSPRCR